MKNKIEDLRNHLFATLEALSDTENPMELDRAKAICEVGQVIINSAKVEVDFINKVGGTGTNFIPQEQRQKQIS
jgi:hypothetical protein